LPEPGSAAAAVTSREISAAATASPAVTGSQAQALDAADGADMGPGGAVAAAAVGAAVLAAVSYAAVRGGRAGVGGGGGGERGDIIYRRLSMKYDLIDNYLLEYIIIYKLRPSWMTTPEFFSCAE
jgi:hypothetical protein